MTDRDDLAYTLNPMQWDTDFFGLSCAKAVLARPLSKEDWSELKSRLDKFQLVYLENQNSLPVNARLIGLETSAYLVDVNVQFSKQLLGTNAQTDNIQIMNPMPYEERLLDLVEYKWSRFTDDPGLSSRGGDQVYRQWLINAFNKEDKHCALSLDQNGKIIGYLLHSYAGSACRIELIASSPDRAGRGVGTSLVKAVAQAAYQRGMEAIQVGTQLRNLVAINFYHRLGFMQVGSHQIYHLWNIEAKQ
ncbi:MAG: GNAT family N-acetyltransferase [Syntrophomonadaceae bacterium]